MTTFARFNLVGLAGFVVQAGVLAALHTIGACVALATCLAVEAAILHNFVWHERWTWAGTTRGSRAGRLARFHASNGLISMAGNVALTGVLVQAGAPLVVGNAAAAGICALANFAAAHAWVFCATTWPIFHGRLQ
jgi:putative flippase GtrA